MMPGDIIIAVNDQRVSNFDELSNALEQYQVGQNVKIRILRDGEERTVTVRLQDVEQ